MAIESSPKQLPSEWHILLSLGHFQYIIDTYASPEAWAHQMSSMTQSRHDAFKTSSTSRAVNVEANGDGTYKFVVSQTSYTRKVASTTTSTAAEIVGLIYTDDRGRTAIKGRFTQPLILAVCGFLLPIALFMLILGSPELKCLGFLAILGLGWLSVLAFTHYRNVYALLYENVPPLELEG